MKENNRLYNALIWRLGQMVKENVELEQRVHQLMDDYNRAVKQLQGKEKHNISTAGCTLGELTEALDKSESLEKENKILASEKLCLEKLYNDLQERCISIERKYNDLCSRENNLFEEIERFKKSEFVEIGEACTHRSFTSNGYPIKVGSNECMYCRHLMKVDVFCKKSVLCAIRYDNTKNQEAQENKTTDE